MWEASVAAGMALELLGLPEVDRILQPLEPLKFSPRGFQFLFNLDLLHLIVSEGVLASERFDLPLLAEGVSEHLLSDGCVLVGFELECNESVLAPTVVNFALSLVVLGVLWRDPLEGSGVFGQTKIGFLDRAKVFLNQVQELALRDLNRDIVDADPSETHLKVNFVHVFRILNELLDQKGFRFEGEVSGENRSHDNLVGDCQNAEALVLRKLEFWCF